MIDAQKTGLLLALAGAAAVGAVLLNQKKAAVPTVPGGGGTTIPTSPPPWSPPGTSTPPSQPPSPPASTPTLPAPTPPQYPQPVTVDARYPMSTIAGAQALVVGGVFYIPGRALTESMGGVPTWDEATQTWGSNMLGTLAYFNPGGAAAWVIDYAGTRTVGLQAAPFVWTDDHIYVAAPDLYTIWGLQTTFDGARVSVYRVGGGGGGSHQHTPL